MLPRKMVVREVVTRPFPMMSPEELRKTYEEIQVLWDLQAAFDSWLTESNEDEEKGKAALEYLLAVNEKYKKEQETDGQVA